MKPEDFEIFDYDKDHYMNSGRLIVYGDVNLSSRKLTKLPFNFETVFGNMDIDDNELASLVGCPNKITLNFNCSNNKLTSLEGGPETVYGDYSCDFNQLVSTKGIPKVLDKTLSISFNKDLKNIEYIEKIGGIIFMIGTSVFFLNPNKLKIESTIVIGRLNNKGEETEFTSILEFNQFMNSKRIMENLKNMKYNLFIDDQIDDINSDTGLPIRRPEVIDPSREYLKAKTVNEAKALIQSKGCPVFISFDYDLGPDENGENQESRVLAQWLVDQDLENPGFIPEDFDYQIHSKNVYARDRLDFLRQYINFRKNK